ncbi:MAG: hypothetical protein ACRDWE_08545 [Acidimicrobiales bacterium]
MRTEYEFVLPRGYVDESETVHRRGVMRLATARDELEPLRDPTILGPDDPRLTIVVLSRVVRSLGSLPMVTRQEIEGLFAADLAYLQDFYGVINFGSEEDIEALLAAQEPSRPPARSATATAPPASDSSGGAVPNGAEPGGAAEPPEVDDDGEPLVRSVGRRHAIEEVPSSSR